MTMNVTPVYEETAYTKTTGEQAVGKTKQQISAGAAHVATMSPSLTTLIDDTGTYTYVGQALPGTATSTTNWRIYRITNSTGDIYFAGAGIYDQEWDERAGTVVFA